MRLTLTAKLTAIVLALDAFVVPFIALAAWGLGRLDPWAAFGGGAALFLVALTAAGLAMRRPWAVWIGWLVQLALIAAGLVMTPVYVLGAGSLVLWVWCLWRGAKADQPAREGQS